MRILIVDLDSDCAQSLKTGLTQSGFEVAFASGAEDGLRLAQAEAFDALLVDVLRPSLAGFTLVRRLREAGFSGAILFLDAKPELADRVRGLEVGGDDFLEKPCSIPELIARIHALLRRARLRTRNVTVRIADLQWDPNARLILREGRKVNLNLKEYALASLLLEHRGRVVSRALISTQLWGSEPELPAEAQNKQMDALIRRVKAKLDNPYAVRLIHTLWGIGVILEAPLF